MHSSSPQHGSNSPARSFDPSGILVIDKPAGITSHDVVDALRDRFGWKKVGHAGTLDPLATGVLILLVGQATRAQASFLNDDKEYQGRMILGVETTTHDAEGEVTARHEGPLSVTREALEAALQAFRGPVKQLPPMVSAKKHKGRPLYKYARKGEEVPREERDVTVHALTLGAFDGRAAELTVRCSKGTYVRTLMHDIGRRLGCGAHMEALRRTASGRFRIEEARRLDEILEMRPEEVFYLLQPAE